MTRVGLLLPQYNCGIDEPLSVARSADDVGLDIWIAGQLFAISNDPDTSGFEPLTLMGAVATVTRRSRLGFMVLAAPYIPPAYLAKSLATLDHLSNGRLDVGLGTGWREEEFAALGVPFGSGASRRTELEQTLDVVSAICSGGEVPGSSHSSRFGPASVQAPHPPLWIAGQGPRILEVVGRRADWANFARGISPSGFGKAVQTVRQAATSAGRNPGVPRFSLTGTFLSAATERELADSLARRAAARNLTPAAYEQELRKANAFLGTPGEIAEAMEQYIGHGCDAFILWPLDGNHSTAVAALAEVYATLGQPS